MADVSTEPSKLLNQGSGTMDQGSGENAREAPACPGKAELNVNVGKAVWNQTAESLKPDEGV